MMQKVYQPQLFENDIYSWWTQQGYFKPDTTKKQHFTIVIPPPNITAQLHIGHALDNAVQDCLIRFKRMQGYNTLWIPGTDHASIATEVKIVEQLKAQGITKNDIGRDGFLQKAWEWKEKYGGRIIEQLKLLGSSCDWSRTRFTMDEQCSKAVKKVFVDYYNKGLIYQGDRIINWCPVCKTALSDAEVEYSEQDGHFWHYSYYTPDGSQKVTFATTRPETMLGDTAVAVNPNDKRYQDMVGKTVVVPFVNREIPVIADEYVDMEFGTGVVKITPAHDPNDFEVGLRHNLPVIRVMNDDGTMNHLAGEFEGMDRYTCRKEIVKRLQEMGNLVKIEPHKHNVGTCYRCHTTVEPIVSKQWFVKMKPLATPANKKVKSGEIRFVPKRYEKIYFNWMENVRDWCISRQLWWGHRIPVWYCQDCGEVICAEEAPKTCTKCGSIHLKQDEDVLDTWFSSALWPFSTLGWPDKTEDLKTFYPTSVLVTAYDIIFFWVARMIFSAIENTQQIPFKDILIHGIVRDELGRKMSKSLGNGVDPAEFIEKYGADTLRFALLNGVANGSDMRFSSDKVEATRNFMNKIWNASRFVLQNCQDNPTIKIRKDLSRCNLSIVDKWILDKVNNLCANVNRLMGKYELGLAEQQLYDFFWSDFCDWYIEFSKPVLYGDDAKQKQTTLSVLIHVLDKALKLLHPFTPFITEKIYQSLPNHGETIMLERYPKATKKLAFGQEAEVVEDIKELISKIRNARATYAVEPSKKVRVFVKTENQEIQRCAHYIKKLANAESVEFGGAPQQDKNVSVVTHLCNAEIPLGDLVDKVKEMARIEKELAKAQKEIDFANVKLQNPNFVAKAPQALVEKEREHLAKFIAIKEELLKQKSEL